MKRALGLSLLLILCLGLVPGCGGDVQTTPTGSSAASGPVAPAATTQTAATTGTLDVVSAMQSVGGQVQGNLPGAGARSERSAIYKCVPPEADCPPGFLPVAYCFDGTGGGTATVQGCYADGQTSHVTVKLTNFRLPDEESTASGTFEITLDLKLNNGKRDGVIRLKGTLTFGDAGEHSFDIFLAIVQDQLVGTKADVDKSGYVNLFPLRLFNNADIADSAVFVTVIGTDAPPPGQLNPPPTHFYYLARPGDIKMTLFPPDSKLADGSFEQARHKSFALTDMTRVGDHTYQVNLPAVNLISGKIFFALGQPLLGIGTTTSDGTKATLPSSTSAVDAPTMFEQMEMSATFSAGDKFYKLFMNATTIDTLCFGPALRVDRADGTHAVIGFSGASQAEPDGTYCVRNDFIAEIGKAPPAFQNYVTQSGVLLFGVQPTNVDSVVCVLGPPQVIGLKTPQGTPQNPALNTYLDNYIAQNWAAFVGQINQGFDYPESGAKRDFGFVPNQPLDPQRVSLKCDFASGSNTGNGDTYSLGTPATTVAWECDDPDHKEDGPSYQFYANSGSQAHKRLGSIILACFQRGVLFNDRANASRFYTEPNRNYNVFAQVVHQLAYNHVMYGFGYDDVYGQDGTQAGPIGLTEDNGVPDQATPSIKLVTIIIPRFKPVPATRPNLTFSPSSGPVGSTVTLTAPQPGLFAHATNVEFGNQGVGTGNFKIVDGQTITVGVPGFASGSLQIKVAAPGFPGGIIDSGPAQFTVTATTFTFSPTTASGGATLTLNTGTLPVPATGPVVLFPNTSGAIKKVGAPLKQTGAGTYTAVVPSGVGDGLLYVPLVGGVEAQSTEPFTLKTSTPPGSGSL